MLCRFILIILITIFSFCDGFAEELELGIRSTLSYYWTNGYDFFITCSGYVINEYDFPIRLQPTLHVETASGIRQLTEYPGLVYLNTEFDSVLSYMVPHQQAVFFCEGTDTISVEYVDNIRTYMLFNVERAEVPHRKMILLSWLWSLLY